MPNLDFYKGKAGYFTKSENNMMESEESLKGLEGNLKCIDAEMQMLEAEYEKQLNNHSEVSFSIWSSYFNLVNIFTTREFALVFI